MIEELQDDHAQTGIEPVTPAHEFRRRRATSTRTVGWALVVVGGISIIVNLVLVLAWNQFLRRWVFTGPMLLLVGIVLVLFPGPAVAGGSDRPQEQLRHKWRSLRWRERILWLASLPAGFALGYLFRQWIVTL